MKTSFGLQIYSHRSGTYWDKLILHELVMVCVFSLRWSRETLMRSQQVDHERWCWQQELSSTDVTRVKFVWTYNHLRLVYGLWEPTYINTHECRRTQTTHTLQTSAAWSYTCSQESAFQLSAHDELNKINSRVSASWRWHHRGVREN